MVNIEKLKKVIEKNDQTVKDIADKMGIDVSTLYRKLQKGGESFTILQIQSKIPWRNNRPI